MGTWRNLGKVNRKIECRRVAFGSHCRRGLQAAEEVWQD